MYPQARYRNRLCGTSTGIRKAAKLLGMLVLVEAPALQIGGRPEGQGYPVVASEVLAAGGNPDAAMSRDHEQG
jgi:hypothetical protein